MSEWIDISEAPKDGTQIIIAGEGWSCPGFYSDGTGNYWNRAGFYDECDRNNMSAARVCNPTFFLPIPPPPETDTP